MFGWGLGKPKSKLGKWLDQNGYTISELSKVSKVNRNTLGKACSDDDYIPSPQTMKKILKAIRQKDASAKMQDFWDM
ncbi:helix-turn-helix domain-containing protein [Halalkalibacter lacteus]|uniref:helix-turn-helix domain-containing protein n=1 Tax=Halalkalibacter lacteus TaxID=3090663 RepID=UPI002FCA04B5